MCAARSTEPQRFGRYRLHERIAVGGTAEVYRAGLVFGDGSEEPVVLKQVLPQYASDPRLREVFHEEAIVLASLEHPHIVRLRDFGELQGTFFLALEYVEGADLDSLLERASGLGRTIPPPLAAQVALDVCYALDYIHTRRSSSGTPLRIIHRDVSPHNIILSRTGEVKLADFGIARSVLRAAHTVDGAIKGKFHYMAPEQALGGEIDARADLFSLGAVLHEMLLGRPPFAGRTEAELLERARRCEVVLDDKQLPEDARPLTPVLRRCLAARREDRYPSASALGEELAGFLATRSGGAGAQALAAWVAWLMGVEGGAGEQRLAQALLDPGSSGRPATALIALPSGEPPVAKTAPALGRAAAPARAAEATPAPRHRRWLGFAVTMLLVAAAASALTLIVERRFRAKPQERSSPPRTARAPSPPADARPASPALASTVVRLREPAAAAAVEPPAAEARAPTVTARHGYLSINAIPWASVLLDGRNIGTTPIRDLRVAAGRHRVQLRDGQGRLVRSFVVRVARGKKQLFSFDAASP